MKLKNYLNVFLLISIILLPAHSSVAEDKASTLDKALYYLYQPIAFFLPHIELRKTLYETETQYFHIRVEEDEQKRNHLVFLPRKGSQSIYDPAHPNKLISNFMQCAFLALPALGHPPKQVLFIGMGGGIMPMYLRKHYPNVKIDIVEIDREIPKLAKKYFDFIPDSKMHIKINDGRVFVNKTKQKYDIIFIDVYNAHNIPFQFTTIEFYKHIKRILKNDGVCAVNLANMGKQGFIAAEFNTIFNVFPNTFVFECKGKTNYVPLMLNGDNMNFTKTRNNALLMDKLKTFNINFEKLLEEKLSNTELKTLKNKSKLILTDDYAPIYMLN